MCRPSRRRASPRCDAVRNQSRLEIAVAAGWRRTEARIVNISRDGALIVAENPEANEFPVWLRVESPVKTDWAEATIVRLGRDREIALQFPQGCPCAPADGWTSVTSTLVTPTTRPSPRSISTPLVEYPLSTTHE